MFGREAEQEVLSRVLQDALSRPSSVCLRGEAGIGKTTLLEAVRDMATARGFLALTCAPNGAEVQMSFAGLTDLLQPVSSRLRELPKPQREALEAALLQRTRDDRVPDVHTVGAGTLTLLRSLCEQHPLLISVDDVQWLDEPSLRALSFALRRCRVPFALITALRDGFGSPWPDLSPPSTKEGKSLRVHGLGLATLHEVLKQQVGKAFDRATTEHIRAVSRGNPMFARELALSLEGEGTPSTPQLLSVGLQSRYRALPPPARSALLLCSALAKPTVATLFRAGLHHAPDVMLPAEAEGIVEWRGDQLRFAHPMWREVIYRAARAHERRAVHLRLSRVVSDIEERARHLALSSPGLPPSTLAALQAAATSARLRGAPSSAADLLELAIARGSTEPALLLRAARDHFAAGRAERSMVMASEVVEVLGPGSLRAEALVLIGEITSVTDDFPGAVPFLEQAYTEAVDVQDVQSGAAIDLAFVLANLGSNRDAYKWAARAESSAAATGDLGVAAEAVGAVAVLAFLNGEGVDQSRLDRALANEDHDRVSPPMRWPSMSAALVSLWSSDLERAQPVLSDVRQRLLDRGLENGLSLVLARSAEAALLSGDLDVTSGIVGELSDRALIAGDESDVVLATAWRVVLSAWCGDLEMAETEHQQLLEITGGTKHLMPGLAAQAGLGMGLLAAGQAAAAADCLAPVADMVLAIGIGEPVVSPFFADAVHAWVATGEAERAEPLVNMLETWARRSGTRWPSGVGARGRAALYLHSGDLSAAQSALEDALVALDTPGLAYERARTHLLLCGVHRRRRARAQARDSLIIASDLFQSMGAAGWAANARQEMKQLGLQRGADQALTPSERRIAELAASGLTNSAVAARLSISHKTVEAHLARTYRKLGIRTRAELGQWVAKRDSKS